MIGKHVPNRSEICCKNVFQLNWFSKKHKHKKIDYNLEKEIKELERRLLSGKNPLDFSESYNNDMTQPISNNKSVVWYSNSSFRTYATGETTVASTPLIMISY